MGSFTAGAGTSYLLSSTAPVPSGTANGVLYLNGSKVVTSGSALTFDGTTFAVNSAASIGSSTAKTKFYSDSTYNGIFNGASLGSNESIYMGAGIQFFYASGSEQMRLTSTGLGIGTSSPAYKLDVQGDVRINGGNQLRFFRSDNSTQGLLIYSGASNNFIQAPVGAIIVDGTNSITFDVTGVVTWRNSGGVSERMRLDASGNLGLGVVPSAWSAASRAIQLPNGVALANEGSVGTFLGSNWYRSSSGNTYIQNGFSTLYGSTNGQHIWYTAASGTAGNPISFTQAMTLDALGNLGIGTTSPFSRLDSASARSTSLNSISAFNTMPLTVTDTTPFAVGVGGGINFRAQLSSTAYSTYAAIWSFRESATISDYRGSLIFGTSDNTDGYPEERARIDSGGNVVIGTAALATNATNGFFYVAGCAGTPTGVPTAFTGRVPIVVDTTNNKLYFYSNGAWRDAGP